MNHFIQIEDFLNIFRVMTDIQKKNFKHTKNNIQ